MFLGFKLHSIFVSYVDSAIGLNYNSVTLFRQQTGFKKVVVKAPSYLPNRAYVAFHF